jgi:hypothetical protein
MRPPVHPTKLSKSMKRQSDFPSLRRDSKQPESHLTNTGVQFSSFF